jgi:hypothetical protein
VLLWLVRRLSELTPSRGVAPLVLGLLMLGLWDQTPPPDPLAGISFLRSLVEQDRYLVKSLEAQLPPRSAVFELPVMQFPESEPIHELPDYAPLRPFLYARRLRFSYGTNRGRHQEDWQSEAAGWPGPALVQLLEALRFEALLIFRSGYPDKGDALLASLGRPVFAQSADIVAVRLNPGGVRLRWEFSRGWSGDEVSHRWARERSASLDLNLEGAPGLWSLSFGLQAMQEGHVRVTYRGQLLQDVAVKPGTTASAGPLVFPLETGRNSLDLEADFQPLNPPGDPRQLTFQVSRWVASPVDRLVPGSSSPVGL